MAELVRVTDGGGELLFESSVPADPPRGKGDADDVSISSWFHDRIFGTAGGPGDPAQAADITSTIIRVRESVAKGFDGMATDKSNGGVLASTEVTFGIKVSAEGNTFVAKSTAEANLEVKFVWDFS
ncbi:MAG: hypothetical protein OEW83_04140 [Acidimicrobiia bacterium]|nr:hypothetical protein [Acidimicrobiia bacterium]